jgi:hypothetical protein
LVFGPSYLPWFAFVYLPEWYKVYAAYTGLSESNFFFFRQGLQHGTPNGCSGNHADGIHFSGGDIFLNKKRLVMAAAGGEVGGVNTQPCNTIFSL